MKLECHYSLDQQQSARWTEFLRNSEHQQPRQDLKFAAVESAKGYTPLYVIAYEGEEVVAIALFCLRGRLWRGRWHMEAAAFSGPVFNEIEVLGKFIAHLLDEPIFKKTGTIKISPYWVNDLAESLSLTMNELGWKPSERVGNGFVFFQNIGENSLEYPMRSTGWIDLNRTDEEMIASFSQSMRRQVRKTKKYNIEIKQVEKFSQADEFFEELNLALEIRGVSKLKKSEISALFENIFTDPNLGTLLVALHDGQFLGGLGIIRGRQRAHLFYSTVSAKALRQLDSLRIGPVLLYYGMIWAREKDCSYFDVEGFGEVEKDHPHYRYWAYKSGLRPAVTKRITEHFYIGNKALHYANLVLSKVKRLPHGISRRLGWRR